VGGAVIVAVLLVAAVLPAAFGPLDPLALHGDARLLPPSHQHWLGTDEVGRDLYSRVVYGAQYSLRAALIVVMAAAGIGTLLGGVGAYRSRILDEIVMRFADIMLSFPPLIMAMALVAALGPSLEHAALALAVIWWPQYARLARSQVLTVSEMTFVEAAVATGLGPWRILVRHILPNCWGSLAVKCTLDFGYVVLLLAALSFIGLGARPPIPEWGALITTGRQYLLDYWWYPTFPGLAIFATVMGCNLLGDGLRDLLDPQG
jgi:peptide/nickel transport system permease protein